ncbi:host attachment protein [Nordella sp. HKS 07]|uniref:host attachment protein n=1 Tax=Nordella sp. HKS 07 TaxID=2712222 RepID=UPI0013E156A5|nr:host attachment protein [Nordella sp. HKS 07]QIG48931.1 host attachment protein [Nordella sp. HKS 07]
MRAPKTLYIVADGGRVRYIERTILGHFTTFRTFVSAHIHDKSSALTRRKPARVQESATSARHAITAKLDPRDKIESAFIQSIADDLRKNNTLEHYDNLVIVAPARLQHLISDSLSPAHASKLIKTIDKDLTKVPDEDLDRHLPEFLVARSAS